MKKVACVIVGNEDVDKKELLVRISTDLSPKKPNETCTTSSIGNVLDTTASCLTAERKDQAVVEANPRFKVLHNEEDVQSDDEEDEEIPDHWEGEISVEGKSYQLFVTNATSPNVFDQSSSRCLYQEADIFLVCFSVSNLFTNSLDAVVKKWVPEIREVCPVTPFILVGTQINWRELFDPTDPSQRPITPETGALYAEKVGAVRYDWITGDTYSLVLMWVVTKSVAEQRRMATRSVRWSQLRASCMLKFFPAKGRLGAVCLSSTIKLE